MLYVFSNWVYSNISVKTKSESKKDLLIETRFFELNPLLLCFLSLQIMLPSKNRCMGSVHRSEVTRIKGKTKGPTLVFSPYLAE